MQLHKMTDVPPTEFAAARAWRIKRDFTIPELAERVGYSASAVSCFERGLVPPKAPRTTATPITPRAWQRYRLLCRAVDLEIRYPNLEEFRW